MNSFVTDITDDNHICIRCKQTINGLDNYVNHRKSGNCQHMTADMFFNSLQLQYKYSGEDNDKRFKYAEEEDDRSSNSGHNGSEDNSDEEHSEDEPDIYRPPNNFTGGKWKPGTHPLTNSGSNNGITSYINDYSSDESEETFDANKRRNSDKSVVESNDINWNRSQTNVESNDWNSSLEIRSTNLSEKNLTEIEDKECEFKCKLCGFLAKNSFNLLKHYLNSSDHSDCDVFTTESIAKNESLLMRSLSFNCQICLFYTNQSNNYFWHLTTSEHHRNISSQTTHFLCKICDKTCDNVQKLMDHLEANQLAHANSSGPLIVCQLKEQIQQNSKVLINCVDRRPDQFKCDFCFEVFKFKTHLKKHTLSEHIRRVGFPDLIKSNFIGDNPNYSCLKCDFKTDKESIHLLHSINHELPVVVGNKPEDVIKRQISCNKQIKRSEDKYKCPLCDSLYICRELKKHINIHLKETPFECIKCEKRFSKSIYLKTHEKTHSGIKDKVCDICGTGFISNKLLSNHKRIHKTDRKKCVECQQCGAMFQTKYRLLEHIKRHSPKSERPFRCLFTGCRFTFVTKSELKEHSRVHSASDEKHFLCDRCPYKTKSIFTLRKHCRQHTGEKPFECQFCSFKTYLSSNMCRHSRIHSGEKPYQCPYCSYVCNTQENIRKHILKTKKHRGLYVYPCSHCHYKTNLFSDFRKHIEESHSDLYSEQQIDSLVSHLFKTTDKTI